MYFPEEKAHSFERSFDSSYGKVQHLKEIYEERISSLAKQLQLFFSEIEGDEIFKAMQENSLSQEYASQRAAELFTEMMKSEQELTIHKLQNDLVEFKTLHMKVEYDKQKLCSTVKDLEEKIRRSEVEKEKILREFEEISGKLSLAERNFDDALKRKELEWMHKMEANARKMEANLMDTEQKYFTTKKELDTVNNIKKPNELLQNEVEILKKELKNQEIYNFRQIEEIKQAYESRIAELAEKVSDLEKVNESVSSQYKSYQKQSEEFAGNQQAVIKSLVDKSKMLKQKIISQKSKLQDFSKSSKESSINIENARSVHEKTVSEYEEKLKNLEKEALNKEAELITKQQNQVIQLQMHYQQLMDAKLLEMQKEVDEQILKSQEHDREVKQLMDNKMREIERDYMLKSIHEAILKDRENVVIKRYMSKVDEISKENEENQERMRTEILAIREQNEALSQNIEDLQRAEDSLKKELLKEKEKLGSDLNQKLMKLKESETSKVEVTKELERTRKELAELKESYDEEVSNRIKAEKEIMNMNATVADLKSNLTFSKQSLQSAKTQHEQLLTEKVDKTLYMQAKEKTENLTSELMSKSLMLSKLEDEISMLRGSLRESKNQRIEEANFLELEQSRHIETKNKVKELENYSQQILHELELQEKKRNEQSSLVENLKNEIRRMALVVENKEQEMFNVKQASMNKESEQRGLMKAANDRLKKYVKNSVFYLKKQLNGISELVEHEYASLNKQFSTTLQEISIKIIELQVAYRKELDIKADEFTEDIKQYYQSRFAQLEDFIGQENIHWNDPETEGIRRAVKAILEKKHIGQIEIKSLRESLNNANQQNEALFRENQKLQIRLHANNEAFDQLQREVTEEANKIKMRLETGGKEKGEFSLRNAYFRG